MKLLITITIALFSIQTSLSQEVHEKTIFEVRTLGTKYSSERLLESLMNADWCGMINPESPYVIKFDDGAVVNVKSANELKLVQVFIPEECIRENDFTENAIYGLNENGHVMRFVRNSNTKPTTKN